MLLKQKSRGESEPSKKPLSPTNRELLLVHQVVVVLFFFLKGRISACCMRLLPQHLCCEDTTRTSQQCLGCGERGSAPPGACTRPPWIRERANPWAGVPGSAHPTGNAGNIRGGCASVGPKDALRLKFQPRNCFLMVFFLPPK